MRKQLDGYTVAIQAMNGFEEVELTEPRDALEAAGATTHIVAPEAGEIRAWDATDLGRTASVDEGIVRIFAATRLDATSG